MAPASEHDDNRPGTSRFRTSAALALVLILVLLAAAFLNNQSKPAEATASPPSRTPTAAAAPTASRTATSRPTTSLPPTTTETPTAAIPAGPRVVITARDPIAEYVEIENVGDLAVSLDGWRLVSERGNQVCWLGGPLHPGDRLRIWANGGYEVGLHCRFGRSIWSNTQPDAAVLYDAQGTAVSRLE